MSVNDAAELAAFIESQFVVLDELVEFLDSVVVNRNSAERDRSDGLVVAAIFENYYTCVETVLFRIAQNFGNRVDSERWHASLLERVNTEVPGIRPRILEAYTSERLDELRRFRHFKRYYYRLDYDWDKLDFVVKKLTEVNKALRDDLSKFVQFLGNLE